MSVAATIQSCLSEHNVDFDIVPHPKSYSSHETSQMAHIFEDHIAKAVIVEDQQGYAMVVIPASNWLKLHALNEELDREFHLVDESSLADIFIDCQEGAIPPLGPCYHLETFLDEQLSSLANVYLEAGDHENLLHVSGEAFLSMLKGVRHGHFSHR